MSPSTHARLHDLVKAIRRQRTITSLLPAKATTIEHLTAVSEASRQFCFAHTALTSAELSSFETMFSALDGDACAENQPLSTCAQVVDLDGAVAWQSASDYDQQFDNLAFHPSDAKHLRCRDLTAVSDHHYLWPRTAALGRFTGIWKLIIVDSERGSKRAATDFLQTLSHPGSTVADAFRALGDAAFLCRQASQIPLWKDSGVVNSKKAAVKFSEQSKKVKDAWNDVTASMDDSFTIDGSRALSFAAVRAFDEALGTLAAMCYKPYEV